MTAAVGVSAALLVVAALVLHRAQLERRRALREALHELRRPLQALMLAARPDSCETALLAQLRVAAADLEDVAEGRRPAPARERFTVGELLSEAEERWPGAPVAITTSVGRGREIEGDRIRLGMALDNLIANGLEHGGAPVGVGARDGGGGRVRLEVVNGTGGADRPANHRPAGSRRGNGLRIAARHAAADSGRLEGPHMEGERVVAAVELPAGPGPGPSAA